MLDDMCHKLFEWKFFLLTNNLANFGQILALWHLSGVVCGKHSGFVIETVSESVNDHGMAQIFVMGWPQTKHVIEIFDVFSNSLAMFAKF